MPKIYERCIKDVKAKIRKGKIRKTYLNKKGKRMKSNAYAICNRLRKGKK